MPDAQQRGWSTTRRAVLLIVVLVGVGLGVAATHRLALERVGLAHSLEWTAAAYLRSMRLPAPEQAQALAVVRRYAARVEAGEITPAQGRLALAALLEGPIPVLIAARGFARQYVEPLKDEEMSAVEKKAAGVVIQRFSYGVATGQIPRAAAASLVALVTEPQTPSGEPRRLRGRLTRAELQEALAYMRRAADAAGVGTEVPFVDLAAALQQAIDAGQRQAAPVD